MRRAFAVALGLGSLACAEGEPVPDTLALTQSAMAPAVRIVAPADGDTTGADVTIVLGVEGVTVERASGIRVDGIGHHHLFLDTVAVADDSIIPATTRNIVHIGTGDSTYTFTGLAPGPHEVIAVLGFGNHAAMPARRDTVRFIVRP
jgi:hypothetical protein